MNSVVAKENDRLDLICWKHYGSLSGRAVEQALEANPGLSADEELSSGTIVLLPEIEALPLERSLW
ncbi:tail protein X [Synergistes jonesii]|uniref:tail protein X n=1 Tax=Synergistes jonesii TaxID=2754 RepID=UPI00248DBAC3|nr:tail protein X [Synergistes jonesii]